MEFNVLAHRADLVRSIKRSPIPKYALAFMLLAYVVATLFFVQGSHAVVCMNNGSCTTSYSLCNASICTNVPVNCIISGNVNTCPTIYSPTLTTVVAPSTVYVATVVSDTATLGGGSTSPPPGGFMTFEVFIGGSCDPGHLIHFGTVAVSGDGSYASPFTFTPSMPHPFSWEVTYSGDTNNNGLDTCEPFTASPVPTTTSTSIFAAFTTSPDITGTSQPLGTSVYDQATVTATDSSTPTGTVTYHFFTDGTCGASDEVSNSNFPDTVSLSSGNVPASNPTGSLSAGSYSFNAVYSSDDNRLAGSASTCETLTISKATPIVTTHVLNAAGTDVTGATVVAGTSVHDTATLSGAVSGFSISGSVTYNFFSNGACTGTPTTETVTITSGGTVPDSSPQTLGSGSYSYSATYNGDGNYNSVTSPCEPFSVTKQIITNSQFCSFGNQLNLIYVQNSKGTFKLSGSNPGQFDDNILYTAAPGSSFSLTIPIPFPFVTQGSNPIQSGSTQGTTSSGCYIPSSDQTKHDAISTAGGHLSPSGHPVILLGDYGAGANLGSTTTITVSGVVPSTGLVYITVHLSYGLLGQPFNKLTTGTSTTGLSCTSSAPCAQWTTNTAVIIGYGQTYPPFVGVNGLTLTSINTFDKDPGIAGLVTSAATGNPISGVTVQIYNSKGALVASLTTDQNGYYAYSYTGSSATFTIKLPAYGVSQTVTTSSGSYTVVNFSV